MDGVRRRIIGNDLTEVDAEKRFMMEQNLFGTKGSYSIVADIFVMFISIFYDSWLLLQER